MSTIKEQIMQELLQRINAAPRLAKNIRRNHLVFATREESPVIDVRERQDGPVGNRVNKECGQQRSLEVQVWIKVRSDAAREDIDVMWNAMQSRLKEAWPRGILIEEGATQWNDQIADADYCELVQAITFKYATPKWTLDINSNV